MIKQYFVYRFLKIIMTSWENTPAFKSGVLDANGRLLISYKNMNNKQRNSYDIFDRLAYNLKRLMKTLPGGSTKIISYIAAINLIKEHCGISIAEEIDFQLSNIEKETDEDAPISTSSNISGYPKSLGIARRKKIAN